MTDPESTSKRSVNFPNAAQPGPVGPVQPLPVPSGTGPLKARYAGGESFGFNG